LNATTSLLYARRCTSHFQRARRRLFWSTSASCHLTASSKVPQCLMNPLWRGLSGSAGLSNQSLTMKNKGGPSALKHIPSNKVTTTQSPTLSCLNRHRSWLRNFHSENFCNEQSTGTLSSPSIAHVTSSSVSSRGIMSFLTISPAQDVLSETFPSPYKMKTDSPRCETHGPRFL
jgi:hypothetical protein